MERRLIVLRHAKSAWDGDAPSDHARPLNKRGRHDAPRMGERLRELGWIPERIISSDAMRTRETWELLKAGLGSDIGIAFTRELYLAGPAGVWAALRPLADTVRTAMVLGHNPGWEDVVAALSGVTESLGTCNAALLSVDADSWSDAVAMAGRWKLHQVVRPKEL